MEPHVRAGNDKEYAATTVLRMSLAEAARKTRTGPPKDDDEDLQLPVWAGVLPLACTRAAPVAAPGCSGAMPDYVRGWQG